MYDLIGYFKELNGAEWKIIQTDNIGPRKYWIQKQSNGIDSQCKPFIYGFYCDSFDTIRHFLTNN